METTKIRPNKMKNPIMVTLSSNFLLIFLPLAISIALVRSLDPSRAGMGKRLKTARFTEI